MTIVILSWKIFWNKHLHQHHLPGQVVLKHCCLWRSGPRHWCRGSPGGQVLSRLIEPVPQEVLQGLQGPQELHFLQPCSSVGPLSAATEESGQSATLLHTWVELVDTELKRYQHIILLLLFILIVKTAAESVNHIKISFRFFLIKTHYFVPMKTWCLQKRCCILSKALTVSVCPDLSCFTYPITQHLPCWRGHRIHPHRWILDRWQWCSCCQGALETHFYLDMEQPRDGTRFHLMKINHQGVQWMYIMSVHSFKR